MNNLRKLFLFDKEEDQELSFQQTDIEEIFTILSYWFGNTEVLRKNTKQQTFSYYDDLWRNRWFAKGLIQKSVDNFLKDNMESVVISARKGEKDHWQSTPYGCLALIIVLDQFTRNIYRGTKEAWSGDSQALSICLKGIKDGKYSALPPIMRAQYLMPLVHAEDLVLQQKSVDMYQDLYQEICDRNPGVKLIFDRFQRISKVHYSSVLTFGRFPERNEGLARVPTFEEQIYLKNTLVMKEEY